jgi:hypothetical protein
MQTELQSQISRLLEEAQDYAQQGEREKAYQISLRATSVAPDEPLAWYVRSRNAPSYEEQLMCLSRAYALDTKRPEARTELRTAVQELLQKEPFLAYVYETPELYQVRSGRDLLVNIPKNRAYETPYLKRNPGPAAPAYRLLYLSLIGLLLGGIGAVILAPIAVFQVLRLQSTSLSHSDRIRARVILVFSVIIWLAAIPISWLLLIRFIQT